MTAILSLLDMFFLAFHALLSLFNAAGWIWKRTRCFHLVAVSLTAFSWFVLGAWYGWGYCFCTDWHWRVHEALGRPIRSHSYIHFLLKEVTGIDYNPFLVDIAVLAVFLAACVLSVTLNARDFIRKRRYSR